MPRVYARKLASRALPLAALYREIAALPDVHRGAGPSVGRDGRQSAGPDAHLGRAVAESATAGRDEASKAAAAQADSLARRAAMDSSWVSAARASRALLDDPEWQQQDALSTELALCLDARQSAHQASASEEAAPGRVRQAQPDARAASRQPARGRAVARASALQYPEAAARQPELLEQRAQPARQQRAWQQSVSVRQAQQEPE